VYPLGPGRLALTRVRDLVEEFAGTFDKDVYPDGVGRVGDLRPRASSARRSTGADGGVWAGSPRGSPGAPPPARRRPLHTASIPS